MRVCNFQILVQTTVGAQSVRVYGGVSRLVVPNSGIDHCDFKPILRNCNAYFPNFVHDMVHCKFSVYL